MKKITNTILFLIVLYILPVNILYSQLLLEFQQNEIYGSHVNTDDYPRFSVFVRATYNSGYVRLDTDNIVIEEDNRSALPISVGKPDSANWQKVIWNTTLESKTDMTKGVADQMLFSVVYNKVCTVSIIQYFLSSVSFVSVLDINGKFQYELNMGSLTPGNMINKSIQINPQAARLDNNNSEKEIAVDSIKIGTNNFSYFDVSGPPFMMTSPFTHPADIFFNPLTTNFITDKFTIYYDGGRKTVLNLIGQNFNIPKKTLLKVIQPNGGEKLTPCQTFLIKWTGNVSDIPTIIEYTPDMGITWKQIAVVTDSLYLWTIPADISPVVYLRVKQELNKSYTKLLKADNVPVTRVSYRSDGYSLIAANQSGKIFEWDITNFSIINTYSIDDIQYPGEICFSKGLLYYANDKKFVAAYNRYFMIPDNNPDTLAFFDVGNPNPTLKIGISNFHIKDIILDSKKELLTLIPYYDNKLLIYSTKDGSFIRSVDFKYPISAFNYNPAMDSAAVALMNGEIQILKTSDFTSINTFNFNDLPIIIKLALSPNGNLLSIGCQEQNYQEYTGNTNEIHVIDLATGYLARSLRRTASNPINLEFSKTSSILVIGTEGQPQIAFWNLPDDTYEGSIQGNTNILTDMKLSPEGHSVAAISNSTDNLTVRFFTYPEQDLSDKSFSIEKPNVQVNKIDIEKKYLATDNRISITKSFCNMGNVTVIIDFAKLLDGRNFRLKDKIINDTLKSGDCIDFDLYYYPVDTGKIYDTLMFSSCMGTYLMPIESYSMGRNISFFQNPFDFGELCIGDTTEKDFVFLRNEDPVPIKINLVAVEQQTGDQFAVIHARLDSIINPGESLKIEIRFTPSSVGLKQAKLFIDHSDQLKYIFISQVQGVGIGTIVEASHKTLRFIPEILTRKITLKNMSDNPISLFKANIYPKNNYSVTTNLPVDIPSKGAAELEILWNGVPGTDDTLNIEAQPCVQRTLILLGEYKATSNLSIPAVEADPRNTDAVIKVQFVNRENYSYKGTRFFESEITINPRIFLPTSVTSDFGTGTITRNEVINDRRIIGFRIDGDFPDTGFVANIKGVAGLAETDTSNMRFNSNVINWGKAVQSTMIGGIFKLINLCGDRRILQPTTNLTNMMVSPNPNEGKFDISFTSQIDGVATIEILDNLGNKLVKVTNVKISVGDNSLQILNTGLAPGTYNVIITLGGEFISKQIIILR